MVNENGSLKEETEGDLSLLQQPFRTAFCGFQEAKRAYENGTDEVRHLLLHECSLIYECNICKNLFRSLANFISHKRAFCSTSVGCTGFAKRFSDNDSSFIYQRADEEGRTGNSGRTSTTSGVKLAKTSTNSKDLCEVIERLRREKGSKANENKETVLQLENVPTSTKAVYQTVKHLEEDSMLTEIKEVYDLLNNKHTEIGPDGKAVVIHKYPKIKYNSEERNKVSTDEKQQNDAEIYCEICNLGFQTEKTLQIHRQRSHIDTTYVYSCPDCSITFLKPAHVMKHLVIDHSKSRSRVRMMRDGIIRRQVKQCDAPTAKNPSRELKRLQLNQNVNKEKADNADNASAEVLPKCFFCGETFKRNAALTSHMINCPQKKNDEHSKNLSKTRIDCNSNSREIGNYVGETVFPNEGERDPESVLSEMFANLEMPKYAMSLKTVSLERLGMSDLSNSETSNISTVTTISHLNVAVKTEQIDQSLEAENVLGDDLDTTNNTTNNLKAEKISLKSINEISGGGAEAEAEVESIDNGSTCIVIKTEKTDVSNLKVKRKRVTEKLIACLCKICNKKFNTISNAKRHVSMFHYRARNFKCNLCDFNGFRKSDVANHLVFFHHKEESRDVLIREFVKGYEVSYSNKDIDATILIISDDESEFVRKTTPSLSSFKKFKKKEKEKEQKSLKSLTVKKRTSSPTKGASEANASSLGAENDLLVAPFDKKIKQEVLVEQKLERSCARKDKNEEMTQFSKTSTSSSESSEKRPTRKRNKPVNKDFIYGSLKSCKKEVTLDKETVALSKKRKNISNGQEEPKKYYKSKKKRTGKESLGKKADISEKNSSCFKGSTDHVKMWRRPVLTQMPNVGSDRPQLRQRLLPNYQNIRKPVNIIDSANLEEARRNAPLLDDAFLLKFTKHSFGSKTLKIKACLEKPQKTLDKLLESIQSKSLARWKEMQKDAQEKESASKELTKVVANGENEATTNSGVKEEQVCKEIQTNDVEDEGSSKDAGDKSEVKCEIMKDLDKNDVSVEPLKVSDALSSENTSPDSVLSKRLTLLQSLVEDKQRQNEFESAE